MPEKKPRSSARMKERPPLPVNENGVAILSGGNPQIAKGDGDGPVQMYIANMPEWKSDVGRQLDALIVRTVPDVKQGGTVELALLWRGRPGLVHQLPRLCPLREGNLPQRQVPGPHAPRRLKGPGRPILPYIRRRYGHGADGGVGAAGGGACRGGTGFRGEHCIG